MTKADTEATFLEIVWHIERHNMVTGSQEYGPKVIGIFLYSDMQRLSMFYYFYKDGATINWMEGCSFCGVHFLVISSVNQFCMRV